MDQRKGILATSGRTRSLHILLHRIFYHRTLPVYTPTIRLSSWNFPRVPSQIKRWLQTRGHSGELWTKVGVVHDGRICIYRQISQSGVILHLQLSVTATDAKIVWCHPSRSHTALSSICHRMPPQIPSQLTTATHESRIVYHLSS